MTPQLSILYILCCMFIAWLGRNYRFGFWGYFFACLFFSPLIGCLLVIASKPFQDNGKTSPRNNG
ncbi:hypothetical protein LJB82_03615 [Desulfovibrio sp. OttesenSCG-928-M16]|nr:hypothetical protein [Desulfovibrio sp. OttesenSCG-928-M16]